MSETRDEGTVRAAEEKCRNTTHFKERADNNLSRKYLRETQRSFISLSSYNSPNFLTNNNSIVNCQSDEEYFSNSPAQNSNAVESSPPAACGFGVKRTTKDLQLLSFHQDTLSILVLITNMDYLKLVQFSK